MKLPYNLILTGFMGVGKTTVGKLAARKLGRQFVDTDKLIEQRTGMSIPEIFEKKGEWFFRAYETSICEEFSKPQNLVISTGGGALVHNNNLERITGEGNIVLRLGASVQTVIQRLSGAENRPLFKNPADPRQAILSLFEKRRIAYQQLRIRIDTTDRTPEEVADEVIQIFEREVERNRYRLRVKSPVNNYSILIKAGLLDDLSQLLDDYG
ncbi:MAG: shikimate kinase, partial [Anaerolineae bacterium]|nr:shikimate kinase [Anaerolineae bacterium]